MRLGYNTNGFAHHDFESALEIIAELGYSSVAITLDHHVLNPFESDVLHTARSIRQRLDSLGLSSVIETGARFLLDPWHKHEPTLMSSDPAGRSLRIDFLRRSIELAAELESDAVSLWSGSLKEPISEQAAWGRLQTGCEAVLQHAERLGIPLAFEPEPGMWVDTLEQYGELSQRIQHPLLGLTIDIGHIHCQQEGPIGELIEQWAPHLRNVHIEDMRRGVHEHLMFGEGEIEFSSVMGALERINYQGGVHVELSRHSHMAPTVAKEARQFLLNALAEYKEGAPWPSM